VCSKRARRAAECRHLAEGVTAATLGAVALGFRACLGGTGGGVEESCEGRASRARAKARRRGLGPRWRSCATRQCSRDIYRAATLGSQDRQDGKQVITVRTVKAARLRFPKGTACAAYCRHHLLKLTGHSAGTCCAYDEEVSRECAMTRAGQAYCSLRGTDRRAEGSACAPRHGTLLGCRPFSTWLWPGRHVAFDPRRSRSAHPQSRWRHAVASSPTSGGNAEGGS